MGLSSPKIKKTPIFSQKKAFLIFRAKDLFKKTPYISEGNFPSWKIKKPTLKKFLIFREIELSSPQKLNKTFLYSE